MSVARAFEKAKGEGRSALVGYLPAGYPDVAGGIEALTTMVDAGCDVIEVGLPYSDPVMDGPTIQAAAQAALEGGVRTADVLRTVEAVAATGVPTVIMTYWNPVERYGVSRFAADLASAGGAGLITPDLTPDSGAEWIAAADEHDLDKIFLVAPSSTDERIAMTTGGLPRVRLRHRRDGRDRCPDHHLRPGRPAGRADPRSPPICPSASASGSRTATRPPRSRRTPTASSSARPSSGRCSTPRTGAPGWRRWPPSPATSPTEYDVAVERRPPARAGRSPLLLLLTGCASGSTEGHEAGGLHGTTIEDAVRGTRDAAHRHRRARRTPWPTRPRRPLTLLFFGYTNCPDICQMVMANIASALARLDEAERAEVDVVFVTTDPARDDEKILRAYLSRFGDGLTGLTGDLDTIVDVAASFGVHMEHETKLPTGGYDVSHSTNVFAIDADDEAPVTWRAETSPADLATDITTLAGGGLMTLLSIPSPAQGTWDLGPFPVRAYALCIIAGVIAAIWIAEKRWVARGGEPGQVSDLALWMVPFGLIGGRLYHVMTDWQLYFSEGREPITALYVWRGGLGIWGADRLRGARPVHRVPQDGHPHRARRRRDRARGADRAGARPVRQLLQPGALRQADGPAVGAWRSTPPTGPPAIWTRPPSTRRSSTRRCGAWPRSR